MIVYYVGNFKNAGKRYDAIAKLKFHSSEDAAKYVATQKELQSSSTEPPPIVFRSQANARFREILFGESEYGDESEVFDCFKGMPSDQTFFMSAAMKVVDGARYEHFDDADDYPEASSYFMYGDRNNAFLFHIPTKLQDFLQVNVWSWV